jgi:hypothetical protein
VTPTHETIRAWFEWMAGQVEAARPDASATNEQIIAFHNVYALFIASLASFVLVLRERKQIPLMASVVKAHGVTLPIGDKQCGMVPGPRSVPLLELANTLLVTYFDHILATDHLLGNLGVPLSGAPRQRFRQILAGDRVPLFTTITKGRHKAIGTHTLEKWWPERFGLAGNHGRHYVQNGLRDRGVRSADIDFYVRHMLRGIAPCSSVSTKSLRAIGDAIVPALSALLKDSGLKAMPGLTTFKETAE